MVDLPAPFGPSSPKIVRMNQVLTDMLDHAVADRLGINRTDYRALDVIDQKGPIAAGGLARELRLSTGAVTTVVDRLERAGYARRVPDPGDRRRVLIEIAPGVREGAAQIYGTPDDVVDHFAEYTDDQLELLLRFQELGRGWLEERLERLATLPPQPPAAAAAKRPARRRPPPS